MGYFKELLFHNKHIERPKIKLLKNIDLLSELPFYEELSYKFELVEIKDPIKQLETSKSGIKGLFRDFLNEIKGFKYQITLKVALRNKTQMEKLNLDQFISIPQQKQW